jgi:histidinol phosphatase-like PHP family hydrolase
MPVKLLSPYRAGGFTWLRGNLHTHTTLSDGEMPPEEVITSYEIRGYDFLALSDHDRLAPVAEYQAGTGMALIRGDEVSARGPHLLAVGIYEIVSPDADRQKVIDETIVQGGFAILNHPNWEKRFNHWPQEQMEALTGYAGIEIYNGVVEYLEGSALATDRWDRLLSAGRRVWGFANDDMHHPHNIGRGWNAVQTAGRTPKAICNALRAGRFYASTGVGITRIEVSKDILFIAAPNAKHIRFIGGWGRVLAWADDRQAAYKATGDEGGYIRVECYGAGAQMAWTQPFFVEAA